MIYNPGCNKNLKDPKISVAEAWNRKFDLWQNNINRAILSKKFKEQKITNAVMFQTKDGFTLTSNVINAMKQLFGKKSTQ